MTHGSRLVLVGAAAMAVLLVGCGRGGGPAPIPNPSTAAATPSATPTPTAAGPVVTVTPASGDHGTLFAGTGAGFTPGGGVTISATMPGGAAYPLTFVKVADPAGAFAWTWQWEAGDADGAWIIAFLDQDSARSTSITLTITGGGGGGSTTRRPTTKTNNPPVHPAVAVTPPTGDHTTLFHGTATGFTPGGSVTVSATLPGGAAYPGTFPKTADASGAFTWTWAWETGDPDGAWVIRFLDHASGATTSVTVTITGPAVPLADPHAAVAPTVGDHTTLFLGTATGFTPDGAVTLSATMPGGAPYPGTFSKIADGSGAFTWAWGWEPGDADGVWTIRFLDRASGLSTATDLTIIGV